MDTYQVLKNTILNRRTTKTFQMNGQKIPDEQVAEILSLANWAPTHGLTEPWRFKVYSGEKVNQFCQQHASLYRQHCATEKFEQAKYNKILHMGEQASHLIIAIMQRGDSPKIPALEEIVATACAIQNILLGATALDIASYWGSGGMAYHPAMKNLLQLKEEDQVLGLLYLGYADKNPTGRRLTPIEAKVDWIK